MKQLLAILNSDAVNRYGMQFPIDTLENILNQNWITGVPTHIGHDIHRPIGWTRPIGLYFEPGLSRLVGIRLIPETNKEQDYLYLNHQIYINNWHAKRCAQYLNDLKNILGNYLTGKDTFIYANCVAIWNSKLAMKVFPNVFQKQDKKGLIPLNIILEYFTPIGPGIFKHKGKELVLFAHPYFRKSLSRFNNYNTVFLDQILTIRNRDNLTIKIALDSDLVGYASSYEKSIELEFWWGPKFNEDMTKIQPGVTVHASNDYQKLFNGISKTEFWWKAKDSTRTFEAEELKEIPSLGIAEDQFGCRYVHAEINISDKFFDHFDGAVRMYSDEEMKNRVQTNIKKAGKRSKYTKLFRIDGELSIGEWKSFVSSYFQGNPLVVEYFDGERDSNLEPKVLKKQELLNTKYSQLPYSIDKGMGIRLMISYHPIDKNRLSKKREILVFDTVTVEGKTYKVVEDEIIDLKKTLQRLGEDLELPAEVKFLAYEDLYINLPVIRHCEEHLPGNLQNTIEAVKLIVGKLKKRETHHIMSFTLAWLIESKEVRLSVLGHVEDIHVWLTQFMSSVPFSEKEIGHWLEEIGKWLAENYPDSRDKPPLAEIVRPTGVLWINRRILSNKIEFRTYYSAEHMALMHGLTLLHKEKKPADVIRNNQIQVARAFFVNQSKCSKCKEEYKKCSHSKYLDSGVVQEMSDAEYLFSFWTDKKA